MREILFKAQSVDNGEWVFGLLEEDDHYNFYISFYDNDRAKNLIKIKPETLSQFTGLEDENGKEIFEHDIVRYEVSRGFYKKAEIVFKNCQFLCIDLSNKMVSQPAFMDYELEVIGNKFD